LPMKAESFCASHRGEDKWIVIHLPSPAKHGIEIRHDSRIGQQVTKGLTPGLFPGQHPIIEPSKLIALQGLACGTGLILLPFILIGIEPFIEVLYLLRREGFMDDNEALEIEEIFFSIGHSDVFIGTIEHGDS
jgi:hypothetical protein